MARAAARSGWRGRRRPCATAPSSQWSSASPPGRARRSSRPSACRRCACGSAHRYRTGVAARAAQSCLRSSTPAPAARAPPLGSRRRRTGRQALWTVGLPREEACRRLGYPTARVGQQPPTSYRNDASVRSSSQSTLDDTSGRVVTPAWDGRRGSAPFAAVDGVELRADGAAATSRRAAPVPRCGETPQRGVRRCGADG